MSQKLTRRHGLQLDFVILLATLLTLLFLSIAPCSRADETSILDRGRTFFQSGKYYYAAIWFERFLTYYPASSHRREVLISITKAYARSGHSDLAVQYLHRLREEFPEAADSFDAAYKKPAQAVAPAKTAAPVETPAKNPSTTSATEFIPVRSFQSWPSPSATPDQKVSSVSSEGKPRQ